MTLRLLLLILWIPLCAPCAGRDKKGTPSHSRRKSKTIVVDAGHGGDDYGTHSLQKPRYHEKFLTLATSLMVRDHLKRMGYQVIMTRTTDKFISLDQRTNIANKRKADLFVSIHFNSAPSRQAHGTEIFFYDSRKEKVRASRSKGLAQRVLTHVTKSSKTASRGVKAGNFAVIRNTKMPAILVEGGFLTNAEEMRVLKDPKVLNKIAWGIAKGVDEFTASRL